MNLEYFKNYCHRGLPYSYCWRDHSGFQDCLTSIGKLGIKKEIHTVLVLGSADSSILNAFEANSFVPDGIEICKEIIPKGDTRVTQGNFLTEVPEFFIKCIVYDLIFANSLVYLEQEQVIPFLGFCSHMAPYFHCSSATTEHPIIDSWRKILMSQNKWDTMFRLAGWGKTKEPYLYESRMYEAL